MITALSALRKKTGVVVALVVLNIVVSSILKRGDEGGNAEKMQLGTGPINTDSTDVALRDIVNSLSMAPV